MKNLWNLKAIDIKKLLFLSFTIIVSIIGVVYAAPPSGGYTPGSTSDPACTPGATDCNVIGLGLSPWSLNGENYYRESGNVGIGTSNPLEKLDVDGNIRVGADDDICIAGGNCLSSVVGGDVTELSDGTDGELITWSAAGTATTVATGTATQVLTSNGAGAAPTFQDASSGTAYPTNIYTESTGSLTVSTAKTITHSLGVTEADVLAGRYKVVITGTASGTGRQFGDTYGSNVNWGSPFAYMVLVTHAWSSSTATNVGVVRWQANTLSILVGATAITNSRVIIQQMY